MSKQAADHHKKAAEHHEHAARHHREAAKHHEAGAHEKAAHHAVSLCPACTAAVSSSGVGDRRGGANPAPGTPLRVSAAGGHRAVNVEEVRRHFRVISMGLDDEPPPAA